MSEDIPSPSLPTERTNLLLHVQERVQSPSLESNVVEEILNYIGVGPFQWITFLLVGLTYLSFQLEAMGLSFIFIQMSEQWQLTGLMFAITPGLTCVTNMIGEGFFGYMTDWWGRIWPYAGSALVLGSFVMASAFSPNYMVFAILRALGSIGVGGFIPIAHLTLMEFLPVKKRGSIAILSAVIQYIGGVIGVGLAWWLIPTYNTNGWRYFSIATAFPALIVMVFRLSFHVESPRFLVSKGRLEKAWKVFSVMAYFNRKQLSQFITYDKFVNDLRSRNDISTAHKLPLLLKIKFILKPPYLYRTIVLTGIFFVQGPSYYGAAIFFPTLLKNLGLSPYFITCIAHVAMMCGVVLLYIIMEWPEIGRKNSLRLYIGITSIFFFLFAFVQNDITIPIFTLIIFFAVGPILLLLIIYTNESYPTEIRASVVSLMAIIGSFGCIGSPFLSGYLADLSVRYSWLSPAVWGSLFAVEFIISLFLKHETRQKDLQDVIQIHPNNNNNK